MQRSQRSTGAHHEWPAEGVYDAEVGAHEADDNEDQHRAEHLARGEDVALGHVVVPVARVRTVQDRA